MNYQIFIISELCYIFGAKDAALNKVCRNLAFVKPSDIDDVNPAFFSSLPTAREKMRQLNTAQVGSNVYIMLKFSDQKNATVCNIYILYNILYYDLCILCKLLLL